MSKVVTWLLLPTMKYTTTSMERMHKSGWEEQMRAQKDVGDGQIAVPGNSIGGGLLVSWIQ